MCATAASCASPAASSAAQRPGTAHGFMFLSLKEETGIANAIVEPEMFDTHRSALVTARICWSKEFCKITRVRFR